MANLFQVLTNGANNLKNKVQNLGGAQGLTAYERLFGQKAPSTDDIDMPSMEGIDTTSPYYIESFGEEPTVKITASESPRVGGIFNDVTAGYKENRFSPISMNNFGNNELADGRNKGFAYRLGEGLGSIARVGESPLGRGLITGLAVAALGGNPAQALTYGTTATMTNQGNRMRDAMYRRQLNSQGIDTTGVRGYMTDDVYRNMMQAKQLQDNAEWRKLQHEDNKQYRQDMLDMRKEQMEYQKGQDAINNYYRGQSNALGWAELNARMDAMKNKGTKLTAAQQTAMSNISQMDTILDLIEQTPNATGFWQGKNPLINKMESYNPATQGNIKTRAAIDKLRTEVRHALTGAQFSPKEAKEYEKFLPTNSDNPAEIREKIQGLKIMFMSDPRLLGNVEVGSAQSYSPSRNTQTVNATPKQTSSYAEGTIIKNKNGERMIMRNGQWQNL